MGAGAFLTLDPAAASPMSPNSTAPVTVCTSREMRKPEYAVSSVSTPIAAVPGNHPSLHRQELCSDCMLDCHENPSGGVQGMMHPACALWQGSPVTEAFKRMSPRCHLRGP